MQVLPQKFTTDVILLSLSTESDCNLSLKLSTCVRLYTFSPYVSLLLLNFPIPPAEIYEYSFELNNLIYLNDLIYLKNLNNFVNP